MVEMVPAWAPVVNFRPLTWSIGPRGRAGIELQRVGQATAPAARSALRRSARVLAALSVARIHGRRGRAGTAARSTTRRCSCPRPTRAGMDVIAAKPAPDAHDAGAPEAAATLCPEVSRPRRPRGRRSLRRRRPDVRRRASTPSTSAWAMTGRAPLGYDLDQVYTCCEGGPESCTAAVTGRHALRRVGGPRQPGGQLFSALALVDSAQFNTATISQRLQDGHVLASCCRSCTTTGRRTTRR